MPVDCNMLLFIIAGNLNRSKHMAINKIGHGKCNMT